MARFRLTDQAQEDLDGIGAYTVLQWGREQAIRYLTELDGVFHTLADTPSLGRDRRDLRTGLLDQHCNKHMIFFRRDPSGNIEIIRVLHHRQNHDEHL